MFGVDVFDMLVFVIMLFNIMLGVGMVIVMLGVGFFGCTFGVVSDLLCVCIGLWAGGVVIFDIDFHSVC